MSTAEPGERRPLIRLLVVPALLFVAFSGTAFALARLHLARPGVPRAGAGAGSLVLGDPYRGEVAFSQNCASCHGPDGKGGGIGPKLVGAPISVAAVKAQIDNGGATMPPALVKGQTERDVLAYVATIIARR